MIGRKKRVEKPDAVSAAMEEFANSFAAEMNKLETERPATKIYLSGPMKGYPNHNYPLFNAAAKQLRAAGYIVYNPAEFEHACEAFPIRRAFAEYAKFICEEADAIVLLPAWSASLGVSAELALAKNCGLKVVEYETLTMTVDSASVL